MPQAIGGVVKPSSHADVVALIARGLPRLSQTLQLPGGQQHNKAALRQGGDQSKQRVQGHLFFRCYFYYFNDFVIVIDLTIKPIQAGHSTCPI
jgi:hypothetical protein